MAGKSGGVHARPRPRHDRGLKILILKPSSLGDVVHALPVLRLLKLHLPQSEIFWWLESASSPLLADDPDLAGIFTFERKRWATPAQLAGDLGEHPRHARGAIRLGD